MITGQTGRGGHVSTADLSQSADKLRSLLSLRDVAAVDQPIPIGIQCLPDPLQVPCPLRKVFRGQIECTEVDLRCAAVAQ